METEFGVCPWCETRVGPDGVGGMTAVNQAVVRGEPRWWHQGCIADLTRRANEIWPRYA